MHNDCLFKGDILVTREEQVKQLEKDWAENPRWANVKRGYTAEDVVRFTWFLSFLSTLMHDAVLRNYGTWLMKL
jgi:hypothetical protein